MNKIEIYKKIFWNSKNSIITIDSWKPWKTISIIACTHWNEVSWIFVFEKLLEEFDIKNKLKNGKLNLIFGNIDAFFENKRFVDIDMNRLWSLEKEFEKYKDFERVKKIAPYLKNSDIIIDLHSTTTPSDAFIIPVSNFPKKDLDYLKSDYVIYWILEFLNWIVISAINKNAISLVLEAWQHIDKKTIEISTFNVIILLQRFGFIEKEIEEKIISKKYFKISERYKAKSMNITYTYNQNPKSFQEIPKNTEILKDDWKSWFTNEDVTVLMPSPPRYIGDEICYLMKEI